MPEHDAAKEAGALLFSNDSIPTMVDDTPEKVVAEVVEPVVSKSVDIDAILKTHIDDPDWSQEELEKAQQDPHVKFDPNGAKSPGEFNRSSPLFSKIKALKSEHTKEMNRLQKQMYDLEKRLNGSEQRGYEQAIKDIQIKRAEAVENGDRKTFDALDKEYQDLRTAAAANPQVVVQNTIPMGAEDFFERNSHWLNSDAPDDVVMRDDVAKFEQAYLNRRTAEGKPTLAPAALAKHLEAYAKKHYPEKFENEAIDHPAAVEGSNSPAVKPAPRKDSISDLDDTQKQAAANYIAQFPGKTVDDYIKLLKQAGTSYTFK